MESFYFSITLILVFRLIEALGYAHKEFDIPVHHENKFCTVHVLNFDSSSGDGLQFEKFIDNNKGKFLFTLSIVQNQTQEEFLATLIQPIIQFHEECTLNIILFWKRSRRVHESIFLGNIIRHSKYSWRNDDYSNFIVVSSRIHKLNLDYMENFPLKLFFHDTTHHYSSLFPNAVLVGLFERNPNIFYIPDKLTLSTIMYSQKISKSITNLYQKRVFYSTSNSDPDVSCALSIWSHDAAKNYINCSFFDIIGEYLGQLHNVTIVSDSYSEFGPNLDYLNMDFGVSFLKSKWTSTNTIYFVHEGEASLVYCETKRPKHDVTVVSLINGFPVEIWSCLLLATLVGSVFFNPFIGKRGLKEIILQSVTFLCFTFQGFFDQYPLLKDLKGVLFFVGISVLSTLYKEDMTVGMIVSPPPTPFESLSEIYNHNYTIAWYNLKIKTGVDSDKLCSDFYNTFHALLKQSSWYERLNCSIRENIELNRLYSTLADQGNKVALLVGSDPLETLRVKHHLELYHRDVALLRVKRSFYPQTSKIFLQGTLAYSVYSSVVSFFKFGHVCLWKQRLLHQEKRRLVNELNNNQSEKYFQSTSLRSTFSILMLFLGLCMCALITLLLELIVQLWYKYLKNTHSRSKLRIRLQRFKFLCVQNIGILFQRFNCTGALPNPAKSSDCSTPRRIHVLNCVSE